MTTADIIRFDHLDSRIRAVWRREQTLHLTAGMLTFCRWAISLFLIAVAIDWMTYMPALGRAVMLIVLLAVSCHRAWHRGWRYLRPFDASRTALQLETHHGGLESLLVSAVQLRDPAMVAGTSESLRDKTCRLADEVASGLRPEEAISFQGLRRPATVVLLLAGLIGVFAVVNGPFLAAGVTRIFVPWLAVEYPTYTQLDLGDGDLVVKEGASTRIVARVSGIVPDKATLFLRTGEGRPRELVLEITNGSCEYTIASASRDFTYRIEAGDARSAWHRVRVVRAPRVEQVAVELEFPAYLDRSQETVEALTLTAPEGTRVNWQLTLDQAISQATFLRDDEEPLELQVTEDGRQVKFSQTVSDSRGYRFAWVEREHGFDFTSPRYYLQVASDQAPRVELTSPSANLVAMLGRAVDLVIRARDDHGIAAAKVAYRVNRRPEQSVSFPSPIRGGQADHSIDWDYRTALPELKVGDTVSFVVEVSDRYPGPQGSHTARSETRRITFLSREEYLEQIGRRRDRLLSRVRTIYRQERAAHELVRNLDPSEDSFMQTCQLEAIRQEMVRNQLGETATEAQTLLDDLAANNVSDAPEGEFLAQMRSALKTIAEKHIARAASLLRAQAGINAKGTSKMLDAAPAARVVNTAARDLGGLVLLRGIDSAQEVFARETHMFAQLQASLRLQTIESEEGSPSEVLSKQQEDLAQWTDRLLNDLHGGMRYTKRPLAVLRLIRSIKELRGSEAMATMREAATLIRQGRTDRAANLQAGLIRTLLEAEFSVRTSGEYATMIQARNLLVSLVGVQRELRTECAGMTAEQFDNRRATIVDAQQALRRKLLLMFLPSIPAPRARLFEDAPPQSPPTESLLAEADRAMSEALAKITAGQKKPATDRQFEAEKAMTALAEIVDRSSVDLGMKTQGLSTLVAAANERLARVEDYETRQIDLLEKADIAAAEGEKVENLAESQQFLAEEVVDFGKELVEQNETVPQKDVLSLLSRLDRVQLAMSDAADSLKRNQPDDAIEHQEKAADALAEARSLLAAQSERLALLQDLFMFQRAVGFANRYMADIVAEQRDLIAATKAAKPEGVSNILPVFDNLRKCLVDVAPLLDLVAGRLDAGTPLSFAQVDLADAMSSLESGDKVDALDAQEVAVESLAEVQSLVQAVQTQTGYVAEIVEFLHASLADAAMMQYRQQELEPKIESATAEQLKALAAQQRELLAEAETYGRQLDKATGMANYAGAAKQMSEALDAIEAGERSAAVEKMELARLDLTENAEDLLAVITMLHGLPSIDVTPQSPEELVRLVDVLALASDHKELLRQVQAAEPKAMTSLAEKQRKLESRCKPFVEEETPHPMLVAAHRHLSTAAAAFESSDRDEIRQSQKAADEQLRHFIVEQALILETAAASGSSGDGTPSEGGTGSDGEHAVTAGFISDFVSGEAPKDKRTEWKVLGDRNRAALNQNFARELPLEYRGVLKNYYERVAK